MSVYLDVQAYNFFSKRRVAVSMALMLMEITPFQHLRGNEKENKNSRF